MTDISTPEELETKATSIKTRDEVSAWFFDDYFHRWVAVGAGRSDDRPEFVLQYWGVPLHVCSLEFNAWLLDAKSVLGFLEYNHAPLKAAGYTHTVIPDRNVRVFHANGAAIEVIWSRRRADENEIERMAVQFNVARTGDSWRVVAIQGFRTTLSKLSEIWPATT